MQIVKSDAMLLEVAARLAKALISPRDEHTSAARG
jgi:hypothetical protein